MVAAEFIGRLVEENGSHAGCDERETYNIACCFLYGPWVAIRANSLGLLCFRFE